MKVILLPRRLGKISMSEIRKQEILNAGGTILEYTTVGITKQKKVKHLTVITPIKKFQKGFIKNA